MVNASIFTMVLMMIFTVCTVAFYAYVEIKDGNYWTAFNAVILSIPFIFLMITAGVTFRGFA